MIYVLFKWHEFSLEGIWQKEVFYMLHSRRKHITKVIVFIATLQKKSMLLFKIDTTFALILYWYQFVLEWDEHIWRECACHLKINWFHSRMNPLAMSILKSRHFFYSVCLTRELCFFWESESIFFPLCKDVYLVFAMNQLNAGSAAWLQIQLFLWMLLCLTRKLFLKNLAGHWPQLYWGFSALRNNDIN